MKKKKLKFTIVILIVAIVLATTCVMFNSLDKTELKSVKSAKKLERIYEGENKAGRITKLATYILTMPYSLAYVDTGRVYDDITYDTAQESTWKGDFRDNFFRYNKF